jgi:hypothetical protein
MGAGIKTHKRNLQKGFTEGNEEEKKRDLTEGNEENEGTLWLREQRVASYCGDGP